MEPTPHDVVVNFRIGEEREPVDGRLIRDAFAAAELAALDLAKAEIRQVREQLVAMVPPERDVIGVAADAALKRLDEFEGSNVKVIQASEGSVVLVGIVSAVGLWLVKNTLGASFSEGWKASKTHGALADVFSAVIDSGAEAFGRAVVSRLRRKGHLARFRLIPASPN